MERTPPDRHRVLESYQDGVRAIRELAARVEDWQAPTPCADWPAVDLAGHLRCVAENFLEYLQDSPDSRLAKLFAQDAVSAVLIRRQARQNAAELAVLPAESGPERVTAFTVSAGAYFDLMPDFWDRTHLIYRGTKYTVGDHAGAAAVEWHLHAWDLARAIRAEYRPRDPEVLVSAWHWGVPHLPLAGGDPWPAVLRASGRSPSWPDADRPDRPPPKQQPDRQGPAGPGSPEHGPAKDGSPEHGPAEHGPAEHGPAEHGPGAVERSGRARRRGQPVSVRSPKPG